MRNAVLHGTRSDGLGEVVNWSENFLQAYLGAQD